MRWLANENIPLASIRQLRAAGHDVAIIEARRGAMIRRSWRVQPKKVHYSDI
jgi:hypothetical protein